MQTQGWDADASHIVHFKGCTSGSHRAVSNCSAGLHTWNGWEAAVKADCRACSKSSATSICWAAACSACVARPALAAARAACNSAHLQAKMTDIQKVTGNSLHKTSFRRRMSSPSFVRYIYIYIYLLPVLHICIDRATSHLSANAGSPALSCAALHVGTCELHLNCLVHAPLLQRQTAALASFILSGRAMRHCVEVQRRHESQNRRAVSSTKVWSNAAAVMGRPAPA